MKTKWMMIPMVALALGCTREMDNQVSYIEGEFSLYATSGEGKTKTVLQQDGSIFWMPADRINVFYGDKSGVFISANSRAAASAEFRGSLGEFVEDGTTEFVAVYPYSKENSYHGTDSLWMTLPSWQMADFDATFANSLFPCVAKSKDRNLHFYNVCGGVKFTLDRGDIKKVVFRGNGGEPLAGRLYVVISGDTPVVYDIQGDASVTVLAPNAGVFQASFPYYIVLAPQTLAHGYTMELYTDVLVETITSESPVTIKRSVWGVLKNLGTQEIVVPEMVDLGLPSGTKWASFNLGASRPEEFGYLYAWGETEMKEVYDEPHYKWYDGNDFTKYGVDVASFDPDLADAFSDGKALLDPEDDAATVYLGDKWRIPTAAEWDELMRLCSHEWIQLEGVEGDGVKVTGPNGNSIILPPAGIRIGSQLEMGTGGYWSSSLFLNNCYAWGVGTDEFELSPYGNREMGVSIRPVYGDLPVMPESISLDKTELDLPLGSSAVLNASLLPGNVTHQAVYWASSNERVAKVSSTGEVVGLKTGEADIAVMTLDGGRFAICKVRVSIPEAVDLGLPSGVRWAPFNLGTTGAGVYGDYYAWGETSPRYRSGAQSDSPDWIWQYDEYGEHTGYDIRSYMFCSGYNQHDSGYSFSFNKYYYDNRIMLESEDDAAHELLGGEWRIPSWAEMNELLNECTWEWTTLDGVSGQKVTGPNGNSIFLPASGVRVDTYLGVLGTLGTYWTSYLSTSSTLQAIYLSFNDSGPRIASLPREQGGSIRPVCGSPAVPVESVSLEKTILTLNVGESVLMKAVLLPENASFSTISWKVDNSSIVTLSPTQNTGEILVQARAQGRTNLTVLARDGGKFATCELVIQDQGGLPGNYLCTSSSDAYENPWTLQILPDEANSQKFWFKNLFANSNWARDDTVFYGILDEASGTITIPYGQQSEYLYKGETPVTLYWLDADDNDGKTGSNTVTILKDGSGMVTGLDFDENLGFYGLLEGLGHAGYAYPHITAVKQ